MIVRKLTEEQIENVVDNVVANCAFEGMECSEEDKEAVRRIARGQTTAEQEVLSVIDRYMRDPVELKPSHHGE